MDKLLLLEDDLSLITGLTYALKKQGFEVDVARTLSEADANWADGKYALLILDVTLPDGTGFDFCRKRTRSARRRQGRGASLRRIGQTSEIAILLFTLRMF